jgi:hypothetical protein
VELLNKYKGGYREVLVCLKENAQSEKDMDKK